MHGVPARGRAGSAVEQHPVRVLFEQADDGVQAEASARLDQRLRAGSGDWLCEAFRLLCREGIPRDGAFGECDEFDLLGCGALQEGPHLLQVCGRVHEAGFQLCSRDAHRRLRVVGSGPAQLQPLQDGRRRHAVPDAHRLQSVAAGGALQCVDQLGHQDGAGCP